MNDGQQQQQLLIKHHVGVCVRVSSLKQWDKRKMNKVLYYVMYVYSVY